MNHQFCEMLSQRINTAEGAAEGISRNVLQGDFWRASDLEPLTAS